MIQMPWSSTYKPTHVKNLPMAELHQKAQLMSLKSHEISMPLAPWTLQWHHFAMQMLPLYCVTKFNAQLYASLCAKSTVIPVILVMTICIHVIPLAAWSDIPILPRPDIIPLAAWSDIPILPWPDQEYCR